MNAVQEQKITHFFHLLDTNGNHVLESNDFEMIGESMSDIMGYSAKSRKRLTLKLKAHGLFMTILEDLNKDDAELFLAEWISFFDEKVLSTPNDYINQSATYLFSLFDQNGDGYIDEGEYINMFKAYGLYMSLARKEFDQLDLNKDKKISGGELVKALEDFFLSPDEDSPGNWIFGDWRNS